MSTQQPEALEAAEQQHMQELRSYRITVENREARIAELEARVQELEAQLVKEAARTAEQKLRADQLEQQHAMQAKMHAQAAEQLAAAQQGAALLPDGWKLVAVNPEFDNLMYWLDRCGEKGHLSSDLIEPWIAFDYDSKTNYSATRPTTQGLEQAVQKVVKEWQRQKNLFPQLHKDGWMDLALSELAAQAKQGEQA